MNMHKNIREKQEHYMDEMNQVYKYRSTTFVYTPNFDQNDPKYWCLVNYSQILTKTMRMGKLCKPCA